VEDAKQFQENAALRYLWARHRIKLLSNYNLLWADDQRIRQVTELGLTYNLLTRYTSFVAIDTQVRNEDGRVTTIKQPLPLPQGVSDYAVGGSFNRLASAPYNFAVSSEHLAREDADRAQEEVFEKREQKRSMEIDEIKVTGGLSKKDVEKVIQRHIDRIQFCYLENSMKETCTIMFTIDTSGKVKVVEVVLGKVRDTRAENCLISEMKKWQFPASQDNHEVKVLVSFLPAM
jgi:Ca-activated chloride channel family protein